MSIEHYKELIDAWDPASEDLPDEVALAMDDSEELRAHFDARFARSELPVEDEREVPSLDRVLPRRRRQWPLLLAGAGLAAAAGLLLVPVFLTAGLDDTFNQVAEPMVLTMPPRDDGLVIVDNIDAPPPPPPPAEDPSAGETYEDYGVGGFSDARTDPLSTFAVDVDTGSYTLARRKLTEGFLPPPAAIRVEEVVNYLDYDYPQPESGPFTVQFEASPSPWSDTHHVRIGVQGREVPSAVRKPVHLVFLVDTSGSMSSGDKLPLVKKAMAMLVEQLRDGDTVAIVAYAGSAGVVLPPTPATEQSTILRSLESLSSGGSTAMGAGIELAYRLADQTRRDGHVNRVVIASDGDANVGTTSTGSLSELISGYAERGITLTTLGFGDGNYHDTRMEQLANDGDGNYYYVDSEAEARRVFVEKLTGTLEVIAKDVKVQVAFDPDVVRRYRLLGYENRDIADHQFRDDAVDAGEIGAGHQVTALYEVELVDQPSGDIATVHLRAKPPGPDAPAIEKVYTLPAYALQPSVEEASRDHRMALAAATFAERLRGSPYVVGVRYGDIVELAEGAERPHHDEDRELISLIRRAAELSP